MKLPFWGTILTVCGIAVLCSLGVWQYQRLQWKTEILKQIDAEYALDARQKKLSQEDLHSDALFVRGFVVGEYLHDKEVLIQSRTHDGVPGYHVLTPFLFTHGFILVNRGWIPIEAERPDDFVIHRPLETVTVSGMLRSIEPASSFVPNNQPEQDIWYQIRPNEIGKAKNITFASTKILYAEDDGFSARYPVSAATRIRPNNNHGQYMVFWFTMAFAMAGVYVLRFLRSQ